jgi:hypothetical protein
LWWHGIIVDPTGAVSHRQDRRTLAGEVDRLNNVKTTVDTVGWANNDQESERSQP